MNDLIQQEIFEIEVLTWLKNKDFLQQVLLKSFTLGQMMKNKIEAFLERKEIRDVFDIEFLFRRGVNLAVDDEELKKIKEIIQGFKKRDYYVTLESLLDDDSREYYKKNKFAYLLSIIKDDIFCHCVGRIVTFAVGLEELRYWRTQSKQEIDFVIDHQRQLFTLEVKKSIPDRKPPA